jgi:hypothetical protein
MNSSCSLYNEDKLSLLLLLLDKAEQILSIINLSDNIIRKYNQLKELTFDKLSLEFKPLVKNKQVADKLSSEEQTKNNSIISNNLWDSLNRYRMNNSKKSQVIEFLFDLLDKFKFEGSVYVNKLINEKDNFFQVSLDKLYKPSSLSYSSILEEIDFEIKMDEIKLKDYIGSSEVACKKLISSLKKSTKTNINEDMNFPNIIRDYENKIEELKKSHQNEIKEYNTRLNEVKMKYKPEIEEEFTRLKEECDEITFIIEKVNELVEPIYEKYYQKNVSWYESERIDYKYSELNKSAFLVALVNKFFVDNKYLIEVVTSLQKEKLSLIEERNLPYVINSIQNNDVLSEIYEHSKELETHSENFNRNFEQLMDYINKNF